MFSSPSSIGLAIGAAIFFTTALTLVVSLGFKQYRSKSPQPILPTTQKQEDFVVNQQQDLARSAPSSNFFKCVFRRTPEGSTTDVEACSGAVVVLETQTEFTGPLASPHTSCANVLDAQIDESTVVIETQVESVDSDTDSQDFDTSLTQFEANDSFAVSDASDTDEDDQDDDDSVVSEWFALSDLMKRKYPASTSSGFSSDVPEQASIDTPTIAIISSHSVPCLDHCKTNLQDSQLLAIPGAAVRRSVKVSKRSALTADELSFFDFDSDDTENTPPPPSPRALTAIIPAPSSAEQITLCSSPTTNSEMFSTIPLAPHHDPSNRASWRVTRERFEYGVTPRVASTGPHNKESSSQLSKLLTTSARSCDVVPPAVLAPWKYIPQTTPPRNPDASPPRSHFSPWDTPTSPRSPKATQVQKPSGVSRLLQFGSKLSATENDEYASQAPSRESLTPMAASSPTCHHHNQSTPPRNTEASPPRSHFSPWDTPTPPRSPKSVRAQKPSGVSRLLQFGGKHSAKENNEDASQTPRHKSPITPTPVASPPTCHHHQPPPSPSSCDVFSR